MSTDPSVHGPAAWYAEERSDLTEFAPRLAALEKACREVGRDPGSIGRSAGIVMEPTEVTGAADALAVPLRGTAAEIADGLRAFGAGGFTQVEILRWPRTLASLEAMAPVFRAARRGLISGTPAGTAHHAASG